MNVQQFQAIWRGNTLTERAASQSHFNDLCRLVGVPTPTEADPTTVDEDVILGRLLALNAEQAGSDQQHGHPPDD